jgi:hypothetical protein
MGKSIGRLTKVKVDGRDAAANQAWYKISILGEPL